MTDTLNFADLPELAALADDARPVWLWSPSRHGIVWANRTGLAFWGLGALSQLGVRAMLARSHGFRHLERLGEELETGRTRVDRLRFFRHGRDMPLTCKISALDFSGSKYLLAISLNPISDMPNIMSLKKNITRHPAALDDGSLFQTGFDSNAHPETDDEAQTPLNEEAHFKHVEPDELSGEDTMEPDAHSDSGPTDEGDPEDNESRTFLDDIVEIAAGALAGANIVPFRISGSAADADGAQLTGDEQEAFQAIAAALDTGETGPDVSQELLPEEPDVIEDEETEEVDVAAPATGISDTRWSEIQGLIDKLSVACFVYRAGNEDDDGEAYYASRSYLDLFGYDTVDAAVAVGGVAALLPVTNKSDGFSDDDQIMTIITESGVSIPVMAKLQAITWEGAVAVMMTLTDRIPATTPSVAPAPESVDLAKVFEDAFEAAIILDDAGIVLHANTAATEMFNLEMDEQDELTIADLLESGADETTKECLDRLRDTQNQSRGAGLEVTGRVYGGADLPLNMVIRGLDDSGSAAAYCITFTDISRWRDAADAEAHARTLAEDANEQKTEFLSGISHEIRTSLNPVLGFSEAIIEERFGPLERGQYTEYVHNIHQSGTHLLGLVNDMLDLSKIEAGQAELNFASVDLNNVTAGCVKLMQSDANKECIIIRSNLAANLPEIVADQQSLRQIALNLLSNAVKYTGPGGQVIVSTRMTEGGEQQLRVRDTGRGMSEGELDTALRPFGRADAVRGGIEGTGLGLPLTHALIEANRAQFSIESAAGEGTLVEVTFPINRVLAS